MISQPEADPPLAESSKRKAQNSKPKLKAKNKTSLKFCAVVLRF
jgi:hypothetical protein